MRLSWSIPHPSDFDGTQLKSCNPVHSDPNITGEYECPIGFSSQKAMELTPLSMQTWEDNKHNIAKTHEHYLFVTCRLLEYIQQPILHQMQLLPAIWEESQMFLAWLRPMPPILHNSHKCSFTTSLRHLVSGPFISATIPSVMITPLRWELLKL